MTHIIRLIAFISLSLGVLMSASAQASRASEAEARAMLAKAVAQLKAEGKEKAFSDFTKPNGPYVDRDLRVTVLGLDGKFMMNGNNARMVGRDATNSLDAAGKAYIKERIEMVKKDGKGEQDYKFLNPMTKQIENKVTFFEKVDDMIVAVGAYKQ